MFIRIWKPSANREEKLSGYFTTMDVHLELFQSLFSSIRVFFFRPCNHVANDSSLSLPEKLGKSELTIIIKGSTRRLLLRDLAHASSLTLLHLSDVCLFFDRIVCIETLCSSCFHNSAVLLGFKLGSNSGIHIYAPRPPRFWRDSMPISTVRLWLR